MSDIKDDHLRQIIGAKRRNNIYGEASDYIMMAFLALGGDGGIYKPGITPSIIYGRSLTTMYIIRILPDLPINITTADPELIILSTANNAIPVIAVPNDQLKRVKFYNVGGLRLRLFS